MAWIAVWDAAEPYVFDDQTGERVATCHRYQNMHEPPTHPWSRACVIAIAPRMHGALTDLIEHSKRHFPEVLEPAIKECEHILKEMKEMYERQSGTHRL